MRTVGSCALALALVGLAAAPALSVSYNMELTWDDVKGTGGSRAFYSCVLDGTTAYAFLNLEDSNIPGDVGRITKITDIEGTRTYSELMSTTTWALNSGVTSLTAFYGAGLVNVGGTKYLQWTDTGTDAVWRLDVGTGTLSAYVTAAQIKAHTGLTSVQTLSPSTSGPDGELYWYEGASDKILKTNGAGNVQTFISDAQLTAVAGDDTVSGGITIDGNGDLIWGNNTYDSMYIWDTSASSGSMLLSQADIIAVTGQTTAGFGDIFYAPDGKVYFYESTSDDIMSFDPANAANTLAVVVSQAELVAGPMGHSNVGQLEWYGGNSIGWTTVSTSGLGFYAVPEPVTVGLLALGGLALIRRRK